jgi:hypothetical protein
MRILLVPDADEMNAVYTVQYGCLIPLRFGKMRRSDHGSRELSHQTTGRLARQAGSS